jgi:diguanylate cyclase (GGDEF)-like protein
MPVLASFGFVLMCNDRSQADLERLAATDPLTGVLNRRMLEELVAGQLADARRHLRPLSVLLIDADHFKAINDEFGHEAGDHALRALVGAVRPQLRPNDLIGRLGGEEFVVVLGATQAPEAMQVAERLRAAVAALPLLVGGRHVALSVSIGVATQEAQEPDDFGALLRCADGAMYAAKRAGRNCVRACERARRAG